MNLGDKVPFLGEFFYFEFNVNQGMAFGIAINIEDPEMQALTNQILLSAISVIGAAILTFVFIKTYKKSTKLEKVAIGLMLAGCLGNLIDRAFYTKGYLQTFDPNIDHNGVVDFLVLNFGFAKIPNFNIADSSLVIGTIMLIVVLIVQEVKETKAKRKAELAKEGTEKLVSKDEQIINENMKSEEKDETKPQDNE